MTNKQLVIDTVNHKETAKVPFHVDFSINAKKRMTDYLADPCFEDKYDYSLDAEAYGWFDEIKKDFFKDEFGVVWNRTGVDKDIGMIEEAVIKDITDYDYSLPIPDLERFKISIESMKKKNPDRFKIAAIGFSIYERAWSLMTIPETLEAMIAHPRELEILLNRICEFNIKIIDTALSCDVDGVLFGDDWGQQKGMIMGAPHWRKFIKPHMKKMFDRVKQHGKVVALHSCGDIKDVFPDLISIGLDIYTTFQPEIYNIEKVKQEYGYDLTFWGGISTQQFLPYATPDEVKREAVRIVRIMSKNGGYIASPTHQVPGDIPAENIVALMDVFMNQEKYL